MRILYVEDNPANLFLVQRVARMGNHEVLNYNNGESALENFERDKPDLVLMDVQLAGEMTGLDVVRKLRGSGYKLPIIAVTAYAMVGDRERCLEAGCDDYLAKPLPVPQLVEIITRFDPQQSKAATPAETPKPAAETTVGEATQPSRPSTPPTEPSKPTTPPGEPSKPAETAPAAPVTEAPKPAEANSTAQATESAPASTPPPAPAPAAEEKPAPSTGSVETFVSTSSAPAPSETSPAVNSATPAAAEKPSADPALATQQEGKSQKTDEKS